MKSTFLSLESKDLVKGLIVSIITAVLVVLQQIVEAGGIIAIKENINLTGNGKKDMQTTVMVSMFSLFAEIEKHLISERTKAGLAAAIAKGKLLGRPKGSKGTTKLDGKEDFIKHELNYRVAKSAIARKLDVSRGSLVNFINSRELE